MNGYLTLIENLLLSMVNTTSNEYRFVNFHQNTYFCFNVANFILNTMIWLYIIVGVIIYILITLMLHIRAKQKFQNEIDVANQKLYEAETNFDNKLNPILELIYHQYGENYVHKIKERIISVGMPSEILQMSWGKPFDVKKSHYKGLTTEKWYYEPYINRLKNVQFDVEVLLENNIVVGWKDLN